jgi:hypothetical protein
VAEAWSGRSKGLVAGQRLGLHGARRGGSRAGELLDESSMGAAVNLKLCAWSAQGQDSSAVVRSEVSPVLAGAARAKADKVVAAAWSARLDSVKAGAGEKVKVSGVVKRKPGDAVGAAEAVEDVGDAVDVAALGEWDSGDVRPEVRRRNAVEFAEKKGAMQIEWRAGLHPKARLWRGFR